MPHGEQHQRNGNRDGDPQTDFPGEHFCVPHFLLLRFVLNDRESRLLDRLLNLIQRELLWIILHMGFLRGEIDRHVLHAVQLLQHPFNGRAAGCALHVPDTDVLFFHDQTTS
jgi:hypothetical protein